MFTTILGFFLGIGLAILSIFLVFSEINYLFSNLPLILFPAALLEGTWLEGVCSGMFGCINYEIFVNGVFWAIVLPLLINAPEAIKQTPKKFLTPIAILICGLLIAGGVLVSLS